ncbi:MAG: anti-sigma factor family protein [Woeseiaceae bacterium]
MDELRSTKHDAIDQLLPWYVNDTLEDHERTEVEGHLAECETCQGSVRLLKGVRSVVREDSPVPIVPEPDTDSLFAVIDADEAGHSASSRGVKYMLAASILLAIGVTVTILGIRQFDVHTPTQFETVISEPTDETTQYIVEMRFAEDVSISERQQLLGALGDITSNTALDSEILTLHLSAGSLTTLQQRIDEVRSQPQVLDARIVAVHLPVD